MTTPTMSTQPTRAPARAPARALGPPTSMGLYRLVSRATLAPSSHNTQPWMFVPSRRGVCVRADAHRRLLVADPDDRELLMSCGAAVLTFRVAAAARGYGTRVGHAHLTDVACLTWTSTPDPALVALSDSVARRHVRRGPLGEEPVDESVVAELCEAAAAEGAELALVPAGTARAELADLVAEGDLRQYADPAWRRELASWMRPRGSADGLARPRFTGPLAPWAVRHVDLGRLMARRDRRRALEAPVAAVLTTPGDTRADRLAAGQAFQRVSLLATRHHLGVGLLNQPCQVPELRARLGSLVEDGTPQLVLAVGVPRGRAGRTERRLPGEVLSRWLGPAGPGTHPEPGGTRVPPRLLGGISGR